MSSTLFDLFTEADSVSTNIERALRYESIMGKIGLGLMEFMLSDGTIVHASDNVCRWLNLPLGALIDKSFGDFLLDEDKEETWRCFAQDVPISRPFFNRYVRPDGVVVHIEWVAAEASGSQAFAACRKIDPRAWEFLSGGKAGYGRQ